MDVVAAATRPRTNEWTNANNLILANDAATEDNIEFMGAGEFRRT